MAAAKKKMPAIDVPQNDGAADAILKTYGETFNALTHLEADLGSALAFAKSLFEAQASPLQAQLIQMDQQLAAYAAAHRDRLTENGKTKTVTLPAGELGWRKDPPSVKWKAGFKNETIVQVIAAEIETLKGSKIKADVERIVKLRAFMRIKAEPNKEAMLADPDLAKEIEGVRIMPGEEQFYIAPFGAELAEPKP